MRHFRPRYFLPGRAVATLAVGSSSSCAGLLSVWQCRAGGRRWHACRSLRPGCCGVPCGSAFRATLRRCPRRGRCRYGAGRESAFQPAQPSIAQATRAAHRNCYSEGTPDGLVNTSASFCGERTGQVPKHVGLVILGRAMRRPAADLGGSYEYPPSGISVNDRSIFTIVMSRSKVTTVQGSQLAPLETSVWREKDEGPISRIA
jgi:hypothetical protein